MIVTTKGRYALRVLVELAEHRDAPDGFLPLREIARHQGISGKYLGAILRDLAVAGLVFGSRGKHGGYLLSKQPGEITVGQVLRLTEGRPTAVACLAPDAPPCPRAQVCPTLPVWQELDELVNHFLDSYTLEDILVRQQARRQAAQLAGVAVGLEDALPAACPFGPEDDDPGDDPEDDPDDAEDGAHG